MSTSTLSASSEQIEGFCRRWQVRELALFGSILRDDYSENSDIDVLVTFFPGSSLSLLDMVQAEFELSEIMGRPVDLVEKSAVEQSENWIRRKSILSQTEIIYAS